MSERHAYVTDGIDKTTFVATGTKLTNQDSELRYFIHNHKWIKNAGLSTCTPECEVIEQGITSPVLPSDNELTDAVAGVDSGHGSSEDR